MNNLLAACTEKGNMTGWDVSFFAIIAASVVAILWIYRR